MGRSVTPPGSGPHRRGSPLYAVDTMVFVYHFEAHPQFGPPATRLLQVAETGRCRLVASVLALMEVLVVPRRAGRDDLCARYRDFFNHFPNLAVVPFDADIAELAADLRAKHALRTPDAIHVATAIRSGASAFVTNDARLRVPGGIAIKALG